MLLDLRLAQQDGRRLPAKFGETPSATLRRLH
jgi:hypothetical protein